MTQNELKKAVGEYALRYVKPGMVVGVGTGSTTAYFIDALASMKDQIEGAVSSSKASTERMRALDINILESNQVSEIDIYIDGADEVNPSLQLIKGGGAALTGEKILTAMSKQFVCIVDASKQVPYLGNFPLPVEVIPMARSYVARELVKLHGRPVYRQGVVTDNGNVILDVHDLKIMHPIELEAIINQIPGVVTVGLFAKRAANIVVVGSEQGIQVLQG